MSETYSFNERMARIAQYTDVELGEIIERQRADIKTHKPMSVMDWTYPGYPNAALLKDLNEMMKDDPFYPIITGLNNHGWAVAVMFDHHDGEAEECRAVHQRLERAIAEVYCYVRCVGWEDQD